MPGVVAVPTGTDRSRLRRTSPLRVARHRRHEASRPLAAHAREVRFVGDGVVVVVAETPEGAKDAAEAVVVDYDELPVVLDLEDAANDHDLVHTELGTNKSYTWDVVPGRRPPSATRSRTPAHMVKDGTSSNA